MRCNRLAVAALVVTLAGVSTLHAQVPAVPAAPAAAGPAAAAATSAAGSAIPSTASAPSMFPNLWGFLFPSRQQIKDFNDTCEECHKKCCESNIGQLLNNSVKPLTMMSGGLIPPLCPATEGKPNTDDLNKPADGAEGAAARIKQQEAEAGARRQAVRYLGTVDCQRFPEAEAALVKALREDTNECVRWEAAKALGHGCCCTKKTIDALILTVNASQKDANPAEKSERVRATAFESLQHCLMCYEEKVPDERDRPEKPPRPEAPPPLSSKNGKIVLTAYDARVAAEPMSEIIARGREALRRNAYLAHSIRVPTGQRDLTAVVARSAPLPTEQPTASSVRQASSAPEPPPPTSTPAPSPSAKPAPKQPRSLYYVFRSSVGSK